MKILKPKFWDNSKISFLSILFLPIAFLIRILFFLKNILIKKYNFSIPVICVGNIYLGGTGKTPFCIKLFSILKNLNKNPVFIKKKYKSYEDEIKLLKTTGPIYENTKRTTAISNAIQNGADVVVLDDGFQDFSIKKNLSIVCFNEKQWIGNGYTIPSGPLREKISALKRADFVVVNGKKNPSIEKKILENNKLAKIFYTRHQPKNINEFKNKKVICFAGIGNPDNFFNILKENEINIIKQIKFPDHYNFSESELKDLVEKAKECDSILLTTEKDYYRIDNSYKMKIKYLKIEVIIEDQNLFVEELKNFI